MVVWMDCEQIVVYNTFTFRKLLLSKYLLLGFLKTNPSPPFSKTSPNNSKKCSLSVHLILFTTAVTGLPSVIEKRREQKRRDKRGKRDEIRNKDYCIVYQRTYLEWNLAISLSSLQILSPNSQGHQMRETQTASLVNKSIIIIHTVNQNTFGGLSRCTFFQFSSSSAFKVLIDSALIFLDSRGYVVTDLRVNSQFPRPALIKESNIIIRINIE